MTQGEITTRALLTEAELAEDFVASFGARDLPERFFYWFPLSVRAWLALCGDGEYRNYVRSRSLIATSAPELAAAAPAGPLEVVSLGSGQGDKDLILLEALRDSRPSVRYTPVDTSQALLELACAGALGSKVPAEGVKADFTNPEHLRSLVADLAGPPRLVMMLGNTLGAFDPPAAARRLAGMLRPGDALLLDGELYSGDATMAGYDNPINRRFAWAPLHAIGVRDEDGSLTFEAVDDPAMPGLHAITKRFEPARDVAALMGGETMQLRVGERLEMSRSGKYAQRTFLRILEGAGLEIGWTRTSADDHFIMALAYPA